MRWLPTSGSSGMFDASSLISIWLIAKLELDRDAEIELAVHKDLNTDLERLKPMPVSDH